MRGIEGNNKRDLYTREHNPAFAETVVDNENLTFDETRDLIFNQYMEQQLLDSFFEELADEEFTSEQIDEIRSALFGQSNEAVIGITALPFELRSNFIRRLKQVVATPSGVKEMFIRIAATIEQQGYSIGFHTSPADIRPDDQSRWVIKGTEADHRDNDLTMAYYSRQYRHLFKKKDPRYIYVVRAERDHRTDGNWFRAPSLSVVMRLPFEEVHGAVERSVRDLMQRREDTKNPSVPEGAEG